MSDYHINVFYSDEDAAYVADIPDPHRFYPHLRRPSTASSYCTKHENRLYC